MDAQRVFQFCRRLLHDREFQRQVMDPDGREHLATLPLDPEERAIAEAFHAQREGAYWPLEGFRYRAATVVNDALIDYALLTARLLFAHSVDVRSLAEQFVEFNGYRDYGLNYCRAALEFLAYIEESYLPTTEVPYLADTIVLDRSMTGLLRRVADLPRVRWPAPDDHPSVRINQRYVRSPLTDVAVLSHDITPWLAEPEQVGTAPLSPGRQYVVVQFLPDEELTDALVIGDSGYRLYQALERALTLADIQALLADAELARSLMGDFLELDVIRPVT